MNKPFRQTLLGASLAITAFSALASTPMSPPAADAELEPRSGSQATGVVIFTPVGDKVRIAARIRGLTPGEHGFHIHEAGDCSAPDAASAKGHFNPANKNHGNSAGGEHHAGDLPNLVANASGAADYEAEVAGIKVKGPDGIVGRSIVIHADADDYKTQPAGNSGKRIACGVINGR